MTILITGVTGFVGSNLLPYLKERLPLANFILLVRESSGQPGTVTWTDLSSRTLEGIDAVIHLAGKAHDTRNVSGEEEYFHVNYELTKALYDLYLRSEAKKFIYLSSVKAAADKVQGVLTEDVIPSPQTPYGRSKLRAENYILKNPAPSLVANDKPGDSSLPMGEGWGGAYILRPCMIHGPGNKGNLNLLYKFAQKGIPYPLAAFDNKRSFLGIDNLNFVISQVLERSIEAGVYNVADDEPLSTTDLIRLMAEVQHKAARLWNLPAGLIKATASLGDLLKLPLNTERLQKLTESYIVSNEKIRSALGIEHMPTSAREALIQTLHSFIK